MVITNMGLILIPIGIILFIIKYDYLLYLTIFFSGFSGSSLVNFSGLSVQPGYYFFMLFAIRYIFEIVKNGKIVKPNWILFTFICICFISLIMPIILENKKILVLNPDNVYENVKPRTQNITQYMYLISGFMLYWMTKDYCINNTKACNNFIKTILYSAILISILGIYQQIAYIKNLPFDDLFRQGIHGNVQPFGSLVRVYSVFIEPSMYSIFLILCISICMYIPKNIFRHKLLLLILLIINGFMSTSSTFILGIIILMGILIGQTFKFKYNKHDRKFNKNIVILIMLIIICLIIIYKLNPNFISKIINEVIGKLQNNNLSSIQRSGSFRHHLEVAFKYPLIGVGFGSVRSYDLFTTWLSSIGFTGVIIFVLYICSITYKSLRIESSEHRKICKGFAFGVFIIFILMFISVPEPYSLFIWISMSIIEVYCMEDRKNIYN